MMTPDLTYYNLFLSNILTSQFDGQPASVHPEVTLTIKSSAAGESHSQQFIKDAEIMNKIRSSADPAVMEAYEQLLTVMALTNGRDAGTQSDRNT